MKLIKIRLQDFQCHESLELDLNHPVICIKGESDKGKSAVLRSLRFLCLNDLGGDEFIREGAKKTIVTLTVVTDKKKSTITRIKGTNNTYELNGEEYKAFGQGVPSDIVNLLNVNEINFQSQHDSPFWFNETAGEVSRRLNAVVDLSVIDTTLANASSAVRQAQERKNLCEERLTQVKTEYEELEPLEERIEHFKRLKASKERFDDVTKTFNKLDGLVQQSRRNRELASRLEEEAGELGNLLSLGRAAISSQRAVEGLSDLYRDIDKQQKASQLPPDFSFVEELFNAWHDLDLRIEGLEQIIEQANERFARIETSSRALMDAERLFEKNTKGKLCPLCSNPIR